jgi:hypothetical protein
MLNMEDFSGPAPTLFSPDPEATKAAISADPARPLADLAKILRSIAIFEHVELLAASELLSNPREGNNTFPFKKARGGKKSAGNTPKRQKSDTGAAAGGRGQKLHFQNLYFSTSTSDFVLLTILAVPQISCNFESF